jgi:hypothetical protein
LAIRLLDGIDYRSALLHEPSASEWVYAIFANVLDCDDAGTVVNAKLAEKRAAQWLRRYIDPALRAIVEEPRLLLD